MEKPRNPYFRWSLVFISAGVLIRFIHLNLPILEGAITRQIQTAAITLNLYRNFDFFHPQVNFFPEPRYFILEPPVYNSLVAALYFIFGVHEYLGRLVSIAAFAGTACFIFKIAARHINEPAARAAVFVFSFSPLSIIYTRGFQPDTLALFFLTVLIFLAVEWVEGNAKAFVPGCLFAFLTFFTKQSFLVMLLPLLIYGLGRQGTRILANPRIYILTALSVIPPLLWSLHARNIAQAYPVLKFGGNFVFSNWFDPTMFLNFAFYKQLFLWLSGLILTPIGFTLFLVGLFIQSDKKGDLLLHSWLAGVVVFYLIFHKHVSTHEYYHLPLLPVASLIIGKAWWFLFEKEDAPFLKGFALKPFRIFAVALVGVMIFGYSNSGFKIPASLSRFYEQTQSLNTHTNDKDVIITDSWAQLYYGRNKGWLFGYGLSKLKKRYKPWHQDEERSPYANLLETWRKQGADYFFATKPSRFYRHKKFADYVSARYPVIDRRDGAYILFDLRQRIR